MADLSDQFLRRTPDALFNSLQRKVRYKFVFADGQFLEGIFHEYCPDGTLKVATGYGSTVQINPAFVQYVTDFC